MKHFVDIQVVLSTPDDLDYWDELAYEASEKLNTILHMLYDRADEDIPTAKLENMLQHVWESWREDGLLLDIDDEDLLDWVDQLLATWDDEDFNTD
ncbi:hypothetical protein OE749_05480 [Aestuariibacter sp. AA17]|uniref:Uncharacterized protein n=1 Tax=Fluctibacter corallii TaxID=2984329 RepID=A0ABT3A772_9ALTE|nr:hypothetical protein [Aestuariibacter sp. AA17]MCV2884137.1 hypothetical protein [Aestuariibacter sp. AA17]